MSSEEMKGNQVRRALAGALGGVARGLSASARVVEQASWILRPREPAEVGQQPATDAAAEPSPEVAPEAAEAAEAPESVGTAVEAAEAAEGVGPAEVADAEPGGIDAGQAVEPGVTDVGPAAEPPPTVSAPEGPDRSRVAETHIAELADRPVADVVSEIPGLSTDELEQLYAYEVTHKNRKTVLRAIERAVQPASSSS